jgi:hypothetical protein
MNGEGNNQIPSIDNEITLSKTEDIRVHEDETNGDWFGIPVADIEKINPDFNDKGDKDGVVWVNRQGADVKYEDVASTSSPES